MTHFTPRTCWLTSALILTLTLIVQGADTGSAPTLDDLLNLTPAPTTPPKPTSADAPAPAQPPAHVPTQPGGDEFNQVIADMQQAAERLGAGRDPGLDTQRLQQTILDRLDQLIAAASQQQQQNSSSSSSSSSSSQSQQEQAGQNQQQQQGQRQQGAQAQAQAQAGATPGQNGNPAQPESGQTAGALDELRAEWGNLPPRLREELLQGHDEKFSPVYEELTEAYYRRLAEEAQ